LTAGGDGTALAAAAVAKLAADLVTLNAATTSYTNLVPTADITLIAAIQIAQTSALAGDSTGFSANVAKLQ